MLAVRRSRANVFSIFLLINILILICWTEALMTGGTEVKLLRFEKRKVAFLNP